MNFANEPWLWAIIIPILGFTGSFVSTRSVRRNEQLQKAKRARATFSSIVETSRSSAIIRKRIFYIALALVILSLARPRWGEIEIEQETKTREVVIAIDLSKSMLAEDLKPNRLERSKLVVGNLLDNLQGESVGLIVFAGSAFLQSPMSPDYQILRGFLKEISPNFIPQGGTEYGEMLKTALESFEQSNSAADRFLIVISDGESQDDQWRDYIEPMNEENIKAICLGLGTSEGGFIPDGEGGFHKDGNGAVVLTKLEPKTLEELARKTNGVYKEANVWVDLAALIENTVKRGRAGVTGSARQTLHVERYQYFLAPGLFLLFLSLYWEFPTSPRARVIRKEATV